MIVLSRRASLWVQKLHGVRNLHSFTRRIVNEQQTKRNINETQASDEDRRIPSEQHNGKEILMEMSIRKRNHLFERIAL